MKKSKATKRTLLLSVLAMLLCMVMLVGTTFAWFTDSASTAVNEIQAGTLDVQLLGTDDTSLEGKTLNFVKAANDAGNEEILWEPGCTYELQPFKIKNNGNLALKYKIQIAGIDGDAELNNVIEWTYTVDGMVSDIKEEGHLTAGQETRLITIKGHMQESADNQYQGLSIKGIGITVVATQDTVEYDSYKNTYDEGAQYDDVVVVGTVDEFNTNLEDGKTIVLSQNLELTGDLSVNKNITIVGNENTPITKYPVYVGADNTVTFKNVNFNDTTAKEKASSVYGGDFKGTMIFDGCTFGDSNWESVQVTPKGDATIIFRNCTFTAENAMKRFIHIEPAANNAFKLNITIANCTFNGCELVNYSASDPNSVIDLDYIAAGSTLTLGGCEFYNSDNTLASATGAHAYFCAPAPSYSRTYDYDAMYNMLTGSVQTYTVE